MSAPTVAVTIRLSTQDGDAYPGVVITAKASWVDSHDGFIIPDPETATTDVNGEAVMQCFPNALPPDGLGGTGAYYRFKGVNADGITVFKCSAQIPNEATLLSDVAVFGDPFVDIPPGTPGPAGTIAIGMVTTGAPGSPATVTNTGTSTAAILDFSIPEGDQGTQGPSGTLSVGTVSTGVAGSSVIITNTGTAQAAVLDITIPRGNTGTAGAAATISVGTVTTGAAGSSVVVTNAGTSSAAVFNFTIPKGDTGSVGAITAADVANVPAGNIAATNVQAALNELDTEKQGLNSNLTALAGQTGAADKLSYWTAAATLALTTLSSFGRTMIAWADAAAARTGLGLGTVATLASDTDGTLAGNSDTSVATQKATKTYVDTKITGLLTNKGDLDASASPNYPAAAKGDTYVITVAGKVGGASGVSVDIGDMVSARTANAGGTQASVGTSWFVLEHNLVGALLSGNNLSDVASASTARTNLGAVGLTGAETIAGVKTFSSLPIFSAGTAVNGAAGTQRSMVLQSSGGNRWILAVTATAESGSNAGSNLSFLRYDDSNAQIDAALSISRATGVVTLTQPLPVTSGGTGVTTSTGSGANALATSPTFSTSTFLSGAAGTIRQHILQTSGSSRWAIQAFSSAESGSNVGSDFRLNAYDDSATLIGVALGITRATMAATFGGAVSAPSLTLTTTPLAGASGGTGVANTGKTITLGGNLTTSGAFASTFTMTATTTVTFPTTGTLATLAGTETLTNKRTTARVGTATSSATPTINTDNYDIYKLTAQAVDITSMTTNLSGTPVDGDVLVVQITGTAARAITWGTGFEASTVALPTTTVTTAMLTVGFLYNGVTSKWRCVAAV